MLALIYMATKKRSRNDIDLLIKHEIVKLINQGMKQSEIAKKFNVNKSTLCRIKRNKDNFAKEFEFGLSSVLTKREKMFDLHSVDKALLEWFKLTAGQYAW